MRPSERFIQQKRDERVLRVETYDELMVRGVIELEEKCYGEITRIRLRYGRQTTEWCRNQIRVKAQASRQGPLFPSLLHFALTPLQRALALFRLSRGGARTGGGKRQAD